MLDQFIGDIIQHAYMKNEHDELPVPAKTLETITNFITAKDTIDRYRNPMNIQFMHGDLDLDYALEVVIRYNTTLFEHITSRMEEYWGIATKEAFVRRAMMQFASDNHQYHDDDCLVYKAAQERGARSTYCTQCNARCP